ncbi:LodA/GoxA family CTQ-dependent oxidase [uncultured Dokdonia sp.]|uniref:LodA/GoxA family CTQ-dependent oxidase n=1 Tax=uncultured Dokdonia sp. TaxID=575653 RepID=UPI002629CBC8|nr:LodA/GoxA family CTQ-dependent oxidase [uncultured Dokdonia sp.]
MKTSLRIHPAIGFARVGNSKEYYLGPETMAASPIEGSVIRGGLPIQPGTESTPITSADIRDAEGKLKRQAARFKIYQYTTEGDSITYPTPGGKEVVIGSEVDGKKVVDIIWTTHLANKKANCWEIDEEANEGIALYEGGNTPPLRNLNYKSAQDPADPIRLKELVIDAGPRAIMASKGSTAIPFDKQTQASYYNQTSGTIETQASYPIQFPFSDGTGDNGSDPITYLGEILTEPNGRLLVLGGHGLACAFNNEGEFDASQALCKDVDNDNWIDDTSDGPVTAVLVFDDGSKQPIDGSAWIVSTDPSYAPQTLNVVSLWDDVYNTWLENFNLQPEIYSNGKYNDSYKPYFEDDVFPTLNAAHMQMWNTNLPSNAIAAHKNMSNLTSEKPSIDVMQFIRNPDGSQNEVGAPLMPLSLGDAAQSFLTLSEQQYFFLDKWNSGIHSDAPTVMAGPGEQLDKTILVNCLGGRFSPGIDLTFIVRDVNLYNKNWTNPAVGPFRINAEVFDYSKAQKDQPFLGVGYTPLRPFLVEPGDLCKFMAVPWHTDYNSCATHTPDPNPGGSVTDSNVFKGTVNTTLFWSWPAQRPVAVYTFEDLMANTNKGELPEQRYSVRGEGTAAQEQLSSPGCPFSGSFDSKAMNVGRYQDRRNILTNWMRIGTIIQGPAIEGYPDDFDKDYYLEVESLFEKDESNKVIFWPNTVSDNVFPPED